MTFIAGPYTLSYDGANVGTLQDGLTLQGVSYEDPIIGDNLGQTKQDFVYRGADWTLSGILEEEDEAGARDCYWPYGALALSGEIGSLGSANSAAAIWTAIPATTASADAGLDSLTAARAVLSPNFPIQLPFASRLRRVPFQLDLLPEEPPIPTENDCQWLAATA